MLAWVSLFSSSNIRYRILVLWNYQPIREQHKKVSTNERCADHDCLLWWPCSPWQCPAGTCSSQVESPRPEHWSESCGCSEGRKGSVLLQSGFNSVIQLLKTLKNVKLFCQGEWNDPFPYGDREGCSSWCRGTARTRCRSSSCGSPAPTRILS